MTHHRGPSSRFAVPALMALCLLSSCASSLQSSLQTRRYDLGGSPKVLRIVHISDLHARVYGGLFSELARRVRGLKPDLILITGDTVTRPLDYAVAERVIASFGDEVPKLAVRGNWDLSTDADPRRLAGILAAHGGLLLLNEYATVELKDVKLLVYGADDMLLGTYQAPDYGTLDSRARNESVRAIFLLCHEPVFVDSLDRAILDMREIYAFSGHTHGGQITAFGAPIPSVMPKGSGRYVAGEYRISSLRLFVSKGVGTSRVDIRFMARPDVMVYEL
jgi:uncharacterized protein